MKEAGAELLGMSSFMLGQTGYMPWLNEYGDYVGTKYVGGGILHQKVFTFSGNDEKTGVSYIGSANSSPGVVYEMGVFVGNDELYNQMSKLFDWWWLAGTNYLKYRTPLLQNSSNILNNLKSPYQNDKDDSYKFSLDTYSPQMDMYYKLYSGLNKNAEYLWPKDFKAQVL